MAPRPLNKDSKVFYIGVQDYERRLFDALVGTPEGTSYNSFAIFGSEKTAIIDTVEPSKWEEYSGKIDETGVKKLDYLICNHGEQDHSGCVDKMLKKFPGVKIVTNKRCNDILITHFEAVTEEDIMIVENGDSLSLGDLTFEFISAPWVHWPDTQFAYLKELKIAFTTDFLGSHLAGSDLFVKKDQEPAVYFAAKRYYAEIMMPFKRNVQLHLKKLRSMDVEIVCPSHGPLHKDPDFILTCYENWSTNKCKNQVLVCFVSMHDTTREMVRILCDALIDEGVSVKPYDLSVADLGEIAMALVDSATVVLGTGTILNGPHPLAMYAAYVVNVLRPKCHYLGFLGSYGWGARTVEQVKTALSNVKADFLGAVFAKGLPNKEEKEQILQLATDIAKAHKEHEDVLTDE